MKKKTRTDNRNEKKEQELQWRRRWPAGLLMRVGKRRRWMVVGERPVEKSERRVWKRQRRGASGISGPSAKLDAAILLLLLYLFLHSLATHASRDYNKTLVQILLFLDFRPLSPSIKCVKSISFTSSCCFGGRFAADASLASSDKKKFNKNPKTKKYQRSNRRRIRRNSQGKTVK